MAPVGCSFEVALFRRLFIEGSVRGRLIGSVCTGASTGSFNIQELVFRKLQIGAPVHRSLYIGAFIYCSFCIEAYRNVFVYIYIYKLTNMNIYIYI